MTRIEEIEARQTKVATCPKCHGKGYVERHKDGMIHYETDAAEGCPAYHFERVPCLACLDTREDIPWLLERVKELEAQLAEARKNSERLLTLASTMRGFVAPYNLPDEGPDSEFDRWKKCAEDLDAAMKEAKGR